MADRLSIDRHEAAPRLEAAVTEQLADLAMAAAEVRIELVRDDGDPPIERATMWLRANPGLPEAPLADVASGGELSRVLLALHGVAADAEPDATWIFDEVDAGVGGVTATAVAAKLAALARTHQVIVITHLPQVAALAERHYRLVKGVDSDGRATTAIEAVEGEAIVDELCRMLGAAPGDEGARRHAHELLARRLSRRASGKRQRTGA
jgi:DNA repair protein RecN (Recombination protein N)